MKQEVRFLLEIVKYILNHNAGEVPMPPKDMDWDELFRLAIRHSILNLLYYGVEVLPRESKPGEKHYNYLYQCAMREVVRSCNQTEDAEELLRAFEKDKIDVLAVKGFCTKRHYPQPEMRTMGDVDILCRASQQQQCKNTMLRLGYDWEAEGRKHDHYLRKPYMNVEMHRELVAVDSEYYLYYENIWDRVKPREGHQYVYEMSLEDEYIYNLIHLVEHFRSGGVGIRFVMDVYVYNRIETIDWEYIEGELTKLGLWKFFGHISKLAQKWFGEGESYTEEEVVMLDKIAAYIVANGTFGTARNHAAVAVAKSGRGKFLLQTLFPNLKNMQSMFPWLEKWPILLPYSWVLRGVRSLLFRRKNIKVQMRKYKHGDMEYGEELKEFFDTCGL